MAREEQYKDKYNFDHVENNIWTKYKNKLSNVSSWCLYWMYAGYQISRLGTYFLSNHKTSSQ